MSLTSVSVGGDEVDTEALQSSSPAWARPLIHIHCRQVAVGPAGERCPLKERVSQSGSYVITGGSGGIGLALAVRLARAGAGGVVLLSR